MNSQVRLAILLVSAMIMGISAVTSSPVAAKSSSDEPEFTNDCECPDCTGEDRWTAKTETDKAPSSGIITAKPSEIAQWSGPGGTFSEDQPRVSEEKDWYKVTGRVTLVKVQPDGDIHIQIVDEGAADDSPNVIVEIPDGEPWCSLRSAVFAWSSAKPPFGVHGQSLPLTRKPVVTVTGRRFYDAHHRVGDTTDNKRKVPRNARPTSRDVTVWEIHPVMELVSKP